ncbi:sodium-dependent bicarbonate transport family permease [Denitromonas ohlonensis]|uniref:Sodium-dependent bicarbonate transport family permease n=2 Tax=Denitromonas TaxID=139331 RepID=A0A557SLF3_9RHOO|nr:sodium-dependent bicarbonate transport family permease [Denitromonas ohlonensis]TVO67858.1 sodium-dependent bicarbonate transport family permease [Denitromonas ohlonensis]TVO78239.1 sodium-dependent bicarbonate transport family permease [Denitromonas ohlonensis]
MNPIDPIILFFLLGLFAGLARAELRLPAAIYDFVSILLLLAIGLKGGIELAKQPFGDLLPQILAVLAMGFLLPLVAFPVLRYLGRFKRADAASIAAHYGSVSVGTYAVAVAYFGTREIFFEAHMPLLLVVLEVPAILVGIVLARGISNETRWGAVMHEVFLGKGIVLLLGGLLIGWIAGPEGVVSIKPLFFDLFKGILAIFLLEMGLITAAQVGSLRQYGLFLLGFGVVMPVFSAVIGAVLGWALGLSVGGTAVLTTLAASASYIAVPAAMRVSVPEANPTLSLTAALGITFPFNVLVGVPLYHVMAERTHAFFGA